MTQILEPGQLSIPKSVFYKLTKEVVQDAKDSESLFYPTRISADAVVQLQKTAENYLTDIFEKTDLAENKILTLEAYKDVAKELDNEQRESVFDRSGNERTILNYDSDNDVIIE
tara:strand:- start:897 stop:1238 length:342 start_codon:yes stop_codon:yes gene_type:complete